MNYKLFREYLLEKEAAENLPPFLSQNRPAKVKEVYRALKRDHPEYSAEKKARIASASASKIAEVEYRGRKFPGYNQPVDSDRPEKKKMVLAKKGDQIKLIHFGQKGYKHNYSDAAKKNYLTRSAGIRGKDGSLTANDKLSANYWARRELWPKNEPADGSAKNREKRASDVSIPEKGLRPGLLMNDLTQVMTPEDAQLVREKLPFYERSGPGLLPLSVIGASSGALLGDSLGEAIDLTKGMKTGTPAYVTGKKLRPVGAVIGGALFPAAAYLATTSGKYDQQALQAAREAINKAREKRASDVSIPEKGLRPGLLMNDLTQVMTPEDAQLVREKLPFYERSGPGLLPLSVIGASSGALLGDSLGEAIDLTKGMKTGTPAYVTGKKLRPVGAVIGGALFPAAAYLATTSGKYDQQALQAAREAINKAREKRASDDDLGHGMELAGLGILGAPAAAHLAAKVPGLRRAAKPLSDFLHKNDAVEHAVEVGGLGVLAVPALKHFKDKRKESSVTKVAYGEKEHRGLAGVTARGAGAAGQARSLVQEGALATDKSIRHPWLPHTDNLHSFAGSQERSTIGAGIRKRQVSAVDDMAKSIAGAKGKLGLMGYLKSGTRGVRGLKNIGDTQHSLVDINAHYNKPVEQGLEATRLRKALPRTGYGGGMVGAVEHVNADRLVRDSVAGKGPSGAIAEIDSLNPSSNAQDASAVARSKRFGSSSRRQVEAALVGQHGMTPEQAANAAQGFFEKATFSEPSQRLGNLTRDAQYLRGEASRLKGAVGALLRRGR